VLIYDMFRIFILRSIEESPIVKPTWGLNFEISCDMYQLPAE